MAATSPAAREAAGLARASHDLYVSAEPGTKESLVCIPIWVIATVLDQTHVLVRVTGPGDA